MDNDVEVLNNDQQPVENVQKTPLNDDIIAIVENAINTFESDDIYEDESIDDIPDDDDEIEDFDDESVEADFSDDDDDDSVNVDDLFENI